MSEPLPSWRRVDGVLARAKRLLIATPFLQASQLYAIGKLIRPVGGEVKWVVKVKCIDGNPPHFLGAELVVHRGVMPREDEVAYVYTVSSRTFRRLDVAEWATGDEVRPSSVQKVRLCDVIGSIRRASGKDACIIGPEDMRLIGHALKGNASCTSWTAKDARG